MAIPEGLICHLWVAVCAIVAPLLLGIGLLRVLGVSAARDRATAFALGYLVGHLAQAHVTAIWLAAGQPVPGILLPVVAAIGGIVLLTRARATDTVATDHARTPVWAIVPLALLSGLALHDASVANVDPIRLSDEAQIWAAKAKVLYCAPVVDVRTGLAALVHHADYPMLDPLVQVLSFASAGRVLHFENRWPVQMFAIAMLLLLWASMSRRAHPLLTALALLAFAGSQFWSGTTTVYADTLLALATLALVDCALRWHESGDRAWWRLACIAASAMLATKNEGALLLLGTTGPLVAMHLSTRRSRPREHRLPLRELAWLLVPVSTIALHAAFNACFDLHNDLTAGDGLLARMALQAASHVPKVAAFYGNMLVDPSAHALLPIAFFGASAVAAAAAPRAWLRSPGSVTLAIVVLVTLGYMLVFVGTPSDVAWHMATAAARTMQQIVPIATLGLAIVVWPRSPS